jgi:hypothetical protein
MGLGRAFLADLLALKRSDALHGCTRVIEIGAQRLADSFLQSDDLLDALCGLFGRPRVQLGAPVGAENVAAEAPPSRPFWTSLGMTYAAIDHDGHRDSFALDLNRDAVPDDLKGAFHLVVNVGTTAHVANQDNAFRVIHDLTGRRGIMYHEVSGDGLGDHGLISYNPKFFSRLCYCNGYRSLFQDSGDGMIRTAILRRTGRPFATPLDLPDAMMPKQPTDFVGLVSRIPGSAMLPPIKRFLRNLKG